MYLAELELDGGSPTALAKKIKEEIFLIIHTGSGLSLIQQGLCSEVFVTNIFSTCGVIGDAIDIEGENMVIICFNNMIHEHKI
jgi:hypothetical protein